MIELYTAATPNGHKISILLEELEMAYKIKHIDLLGNEQKQSWYLEINPNGRIPAIIDRDNDDFIVFESGAILLYLADKAKRFIFADSKQRNRTLQWLMFQMGGIGPIQGQAHVFVRYASEKIPYAIERFQKETKRLYGVLDQQLQDRDYLVDDYSIADIATYPWVAVHEWAGLTIDDLPNVKDWLSRVGSRPAVIKGLTMPKSLSSEEIVKAGRGLLVS